MDDTAMLKGQRITSPAGPGEVIEIIGDNVVIELDNGQTNTYPSADVADESNAG